MLDIKLLLNITIAVYLPLLLIAIGYYIYNKVNRFKEFLDDYNMDFKKYIIRGLKRFKVGDILIQEEPYLGQPIEELKENRDIIKILTIGKHTMVEVLEQTSSPSTSISPTVAPVRRLPYLSKRAGFQDKIVYEMPLTVIKYRFNKHKKTIIQDEVNEWLK
jgi:hypothetical protein